MDLINRLYAKLNEEPLKPKLLVAGSYAQGQQLLERMCASYGNVLNVEVETIRGLMMGRAKLGLFLGGVSYCDDRQMFWVTRKLMEELATEQPNGYVGADVVKPGLAEGVHRAIVELRLAGVTSTELQEDAFASREKTAYMKELLARYESYLSEQSLADMAGLLPYVESDHDDSWYVALEPTNWSQVEQRLVEKLAGERLIRVEAETAFGENPIFAKNSFQLFSASGVMAEVREGFRRLAGGSDSADRTEIILSDYESYAPYIASQAEELGISCTLTGGLPLYYCSAGQAAVGLMDWIEDGYSVSKLTELLRHGRMVIADDRYTQSSWIWLLERSGIGWGRERYLTLLGPDKYGDEDREQGEALHHHATNWLGGLPSDGADEWQPIEVLNWLARLMEEYVVRRSAGDQALLLSLRDLAARHAFVPEASMTKELALRYVRGMLEGIRIYVSPTPKPGAIHVSSLADGGWSGRPLTWIAGMDERAWSVSAKQDPVLLDEERERLSADLKPRSALARAIRAERDSRIALLRGEVWVSYSSYDAGEQKSKSAAFEMLQMFRIQAGDDKLDFGALAGSLGEPYGVMDATRAAELVAPEQGAQEKGSRMMLDGIDVWARWLAKAGGQRAAGHWRLRESYPHLGSGWRAELKRDADALSAYDGWLLGGGIAAQTGGASLSSDSGSISLEIERHVSVSRLEQFAGCGLRYYFAHVLKLRPKETTEYDRSRWLQPNTRGTLLHDVFRRYMEAVTGAGTKPAAHDRSMLNGLLETVIAEYAASIPAPSAHVLLKEEEELRRDADVFYYTESVNGARPILFELELKEENGEPLDVVLTNGTILRLRGFIDRIDEIGPHKYRIIDYKTGSPSKYKPSEYLAGGTQLQHAVYAIAAEQWLRRSGYDPYAEVVEADYSFPTVKGRGEYVRRVQNRREEVAAAVKGLMDAKTQGLYLPAADIGQCRWCDYKTVCGPHAERMAEKREHTDNAELLRTLLEVESIG
ncbi:PD-(D/E)XK nuclease family protein [Paenibacillus sp. strain BS8-2]